METTWALPSDHHPIPGLSSLVGLRPCHPRLLTLLLNLGMVIGCHEDVWQAIQRKGYKNTMLEGIFVVLLFGRL